jgi:hypothetical protein
VLDIVVHKDVRLSEVIVSDILDSDPPTSRFTLVGSCWNLSDPVHKFTDWEGFQTVVSEIILPRIRIN